MNAPMILIQGPQGSGKGTQAQLLAQHLHGITFSSGELWRNSTDPELAVRQAEGGLAQSDVILKLVGDYLAAAPADKTIISDGFPRMLPEAEWLLRTLPDLARELKLAIVLTVPRDESVKRLLKRAAGDTMRPDDKPEDINHRLDLYEQETSHVIDLWRSRGILREVDGLGSIGEVAERIRKVVDEA